MSAGTVARKEQRAVVLGDCFGHRERTAEPASVQTFPLAFCSEGDRWPCRSVATVGLLGQWAGTLNNSAGTTGRGAPLSPWQWPQGDCQDSYVPLEGTPNQVEKAKSTWLSPGPSVCGRLCWTVVSPRSGGLLEEGAEALARGNPLSTAEHLH